MTATFPRMVSSVLMAAQYPEGLSGGRLLAPTGRRTVGRNRYSVRSGATSS